MAEIKYLDDDGLLYVKQKIDGKFVAKETGKGLSSNDYTTAEKNKLTGIETGAEVNVIESITVNGTPATIDANKNASVVVQERDGVPTDGVIGWKSENISYTCDGTETGDYYLTYDSVNYYFTMPEVEDGDILIFNTIDLELLLNDTIISTSSSGSGNELTFIDYIPGGYEEINSLGNIVVDSIESKNVFNKVNVINAALNAANGSLASNSSFRTVYFECKPNTTYTIQKIVSNRFTIGFSSSTEINLPMTLHNQVGLNTSLTEYTFTTGASDNLVFIMVSNVTNDTVPIDDILNSIQIEKGTSKTDYAPYFSFNIEWE